MKLGTPYSPSALRVMLLGAGELGKEVIIALQRLGVEVELPLRRQRILRECQAAAARRARRVGQAIRQVHRSSDKIIERFDELDDIFVTGD